MMHVVWLSLRAETPARGFWDQAIVEELMAGRLWRPEGFPEFVHHESIGDVPAGEGAVVVVPARHHARCADGITEAIAGLPWVLLILTGDEEAIFPACRVDHPRMRVWVQTPRPGRGYPKGARWLPNGPATDSYQHCQAQVRDLDWVFAGQVTHARRIECVEVLRALGGPSDLVETDAFAAGLDHGEYYRLLSRAKVAPCPSGPVTADTFRLWEALDHGCVPVVDTSPPGGQSGYWAMLLGDHPLPVVESWGEFPAVLAGILGDWDTWSARVGASLVKYRRELAYRLVDDLDALAGGTPPGEQITVLMPTSPIPSHPDTSIIREAIASVRSQLPHAEILIMCDGVREAQEDRRAAYEAYLAELVRLCRDEWTNILPIIHAEHLHQSGMTRRALDMVATPCVLFVEHDCPIDGPIPWSAMVQAVTGDADVVRLHHEARILPEHEHLMLGAARDVCGAVMAPTMQWSQRPHLARTGYYQQVMRDHFRAGERTMIEDRMHSVAQSWPGKHRLWILHEPDTAHGIKRSWHLDGRGADPKWVEG